MTLYDPKTHPSRQVLSLRRSRARGANPGSSRSAPGIQTTTAAREEQPRFRTYISSLGDPYSRADTCSSLWRDALVRRADFWFSRSSPVGRRFFSRLRSLIGSVVPRSSFYTALFLCVGRFSISVFSVFSLHDCLGRAAVSKRFQHKALDACGASPLPFFSA